VFTGKTGVRLSESTANFYWRQVLERAGLEFDFYLASKHYCVWYLKVRLGLPDAAIAAQMGWAESTVTEMVRTYAHAVDERRLEEINAAFETQTRRIAAADPLLERD
jgi:hypothetical protein